MAGWGNHTIVALGVRNLLELREWVEKLKVTGNAYSLFKEPDLDGQETAIACVSDGILFKQIRPA